MRLGSKRADITSCHGYGPVDTGMRNLLRSRRLMSRDDQAPPQPDGQDRPNEQNMLQETSPSGFSQSSREYWENMVDGEVSTTNRLQDSKFQKVYLLKILILVKINIQTQRDILLWLDFG